MGQRLLANVIMVLAVVCGIGSLALLVGIPLGARSIVRLRWPEWGILCWDALLSFAFFVQHSGMVRRRFRNRISGVIPPPYQRAVYSIASGVVLGGVVLLWQPSGDHLLVLGGAFRWVARALALAAISLFVWGALALRGLDLFGLVPIKSHLRGIVEPAPVFLVRGPYRWVRHPWYLGVILLFWSSTDLTADRLLFNVLWTVWICIGTRLEEADLLRDFGEVYQRYRRQVPMLVPWRRPVSGLPVSE